MIQVVVSCAAHCDLQASTTTPFPFVKFRKLMKSGKKLRQKMLMLVQKGNCKFNCKEEIKPDKN